MHAKNGGNSSREQVLRGSGGGPGFVARVEAGRPSAPWTRGEREKQCK